MGEETGEEKRQGTGEKEGGREGRPLAADPLRPVLSVSGGRRKGRRPGGRGGGGRAGRPLA